MRARLTDPRLDGTQPPSSTPQVGQHRAAPGWMQCRHIIVQEDTRHKAERRAAQKHSRTAQAVHRSGSQVRLRCARWRATTCPHTPQSQTHSKTSTTARCRHRTGRHAPKESLTRKQQKTRQMRSSSWRPRDGSLAGRKLHIQRHTRTHKNTQTHTTVAAAQHDKHEARGRPRTGRKDTSTKTDHRVASTNTSREETNNPSGMRVCRITTQQKQHSAS